MPGWLGTLLVDGVGVFIGAALGALFGYLLSMYQSDQETKARRDELISLLSHQFLVLEDDIPPFDPRIGRYLDPLYVSAVDGLLDGRTLEYRFDSHLIRGLDLPRLSILRYNEYCIDFNRTLTNLEIDVDNRGRSYAYATQKYHTVITCKEGVLTFLAMPKDEPPPSGLRARWQRLRSRGR